MKKLLLLTTVAAIGTAASLGQGTLSFANTGLANTWKIGTNNVLGTAPGLMSGANAYRIGLYAGAQGTPAGSLTLVGLATNAAPAAAAGFFSGGNPFAVSGFTSGTTISFQLRGWSFAGGLSYQEALTAAGADPLNIALGQSTVGTTTLGGVGGAPPGVIWTTSNPNGITGFTLAPGVPEPSSIALGLLGLGAIALFRRRK